MRKPEIIESVQQTAQIPTSEEAEAAVRATLHVFGERLSGGETRELAARVPPHLANELPEEAPGEHFDLHEFYVRVARYEGLPGDEMLAREHARAVAAALRTNLTGREFEHVATHLPSEYDDLLQTAPVQYQ